MGEQGVTPSQSPTVLQENLILSPDWRSVSKDASDKERRGGERKGWELQTRFQVFRAWSRPRSVDVTLGGGWGNVTSNRVGF